MNLSVTMRVCSSFQSDADLSSWPSIVARPCGAGKTEFKDRQFLQIQLLCLLQALRAACNGNRNATVEFKF